MSEHERTRDDATTDEETDDENDERVDRSHLDDIADGSGCTEIWERLSEQRADAEGE